MNEANRMISSLISHIFSLILCVSGSIQQSMIGLGSCPDISGRMKDFDLSQYIGLWYEQYRHFISPEIGTSCTHIKLTTSEGSLLYQVTYFNSWNRKYNTITGTARFEAPDSEGKFLLNFPGNGNSLIKYNIWDTDYKSYSVVWSCESKTGYNLRNVWIFSREQYPLTDILQKALAALKQHNLSANSFIKSDHSYCVKPETEYKIENDPDAEYEYFYTKLT